MKSPEFFTNKIEKEVEQSLLAENINLILEQKGEKPEEESFSDLYEEEEIKNDLKIVNAIKRKFESHIEHLNESEMKRVKSEKKRSEALEIIITEYGQVNDWFGPCAYFSRTTEYDDFTHGVDAVVEFDMSSEEEPDKEPEIIALAIDASMRPDYNSLERKINRNIKKVEGKTEPAEVKYFQSEIDESKKDLKIVLPVIVGLEGKNTNELIGLFSEIIKMKSNLAKQENGKHIASPLLKEKLKKAEEHPGQIIFLKEIKKQLEIYSQILENKEDEKSEVYKKQSEKLSVIINDILDSKKNISTNELKDDGVFSHINEILDNKIIK